MEYIEDALKLSNCAVQRDKNGRHKEAIYYYKEASRLLYLARLLLPNHASIESWKVKENIYSKRAEELEKIITEESQQVPVTIEKYNIHLSQCYFLFKQALDADESGNLNEALDLYVQAVELSLSTKNNDNINILDQEKLKKIAIRALERAEQLKAEGVGKNDDCIDSVDDKKQNFRKQDLNRQESSPGEGGEGTYTDEEKKVLLTTSFINRHEYVPFMNIDLEEKFQYTVPFTDKNGLLELSPKQKQYFIRWARPFEYCSEPKMISSEFVNYFRIKQTVVSDCSFVASLAVSAHYEKKFGRNIITSIIYPKKRDGNPVYNPFGKYMIRLHINGVTRKVVIDDQLPLGRNNELLCSHSTDRNELWVSLLEKAYMKIMGGYDFPGSNSNIDLHALTGWIPERSSIRDDPDFDSNSFFNLLLTRLHNGDVLVTVATGKLSDEEENRTGLVGGHAYAVIDIRKVNDVRILQLKNPWSNIRWRGKYSELDLVNWTRQLKSALNYDPDSASDFDNGIFWIDYESVLHFFDVFYMNWNPELFNYTYCVHRCWSAGVGPVKDSYNIGENPQFCLNVYDCKSGAIWILLTRHITEINDFKENREYITLMVYKNNGKKVYYPNDPPPYIIGVRINSPHYLCKLVLSETSPQYFTLVVSQHEKMNTIYYTLRTFSTCPFNLKEFKMNYKFEQKITDGLWDRTTAGGCKNYPNTYNNNPVYQIDTAGSSVQNFSNFILLDIKGPKQYQLGLEAVLVKLHDETETAKFRSIDSGNYRSGFVILELNDVQSGLYNIIPSTFYPNQEGPFILTIKSSAPITVQRIR